FHDAIERDELGYHNPSHVILLQAGGVEGVAVASIALLVADRKPLLALRGRPMSPAFRMDLTLGLLLNSVVPHGGRGVQGLRDLVCGQWLQESGGCGVVRPDTGE